MPINSPIANFIEVLKRVKTNAERYEHLLRNNEAQTRLTLIDTVLGALGWDLSNPTMIRVELRFEDARLDYGLLAPTGETRYVIEAKKLGTPLDQPINYNLAIRYAFTNEIPHVVLTDGIIWHFYDDFHPGHVIPISLDLRNEPIHEIALVLINRLDAARFGYCAAEPHQILPTGEGLTQQTLIAAQPGTFIPFDNLAPNLTGHRPPTILRLPDGNLIQTRYWSDVLFEISKYVLDRVANLQIPLLDHSNRAVYLLSFREPVGGHKQYHYRGQPIYINLHYSTNNCIKNSNYLLAKLPANQQNTRPAVRFD